MIIAIDGPSASGKSTSAKLIANKLGVTHIDTGAMYRAVTYHIYDNNIDIHDDVVIKDYLRDLEIKFNLSNEIFLNGVNLSNEIRNVNVSSKVSGVSAVLAIREKMVQIQRKIGSSNDCVLEGRDIGTVVFPNADFKFFLDADIKTRAKRRLSEYESLGERYSLDKIISSIKKRDEMDSNREHSPLKRAHESILIDTSNLTIKDQVNKILGIIKEQEKEHQKYV